MSDTFIRQMLEGQFEGPPPKVLIADDEPSVVDVLRRILEGDQLRIDTAANGTEAIEKLKAGEFDVAVVDILMPGADGIAVLKHIKRHTPETEVILITGHATIETAIEAVHDGAADYLQKPFDDLRIFKVAVRRALGRRELVRLVQKYRSMQESTAQALQSQRDKYEHLAEVARVCVGRTLETIAHLNKLIDSHLSDDDRADIALMKKDNDELLELLDDFLKE